LRVSDLCLFFFVVARKVGCYMEKNMTTHNERRIVMNNENGIETIEDAIRAFESFINEGTHLTEEQVEKMNSLFKEHDIGVTVGVF